MMWLPHTARNRNTSRVRAAAPTSLSRDGARREHGGDARTVFQPRVEQRLRIRDLVPARARDVLDRDREISCFERAVSNGLNGPIAFDEHALTTVIDHDFGDRRIAEKILDGSQEGENAVEAAHNCPRAT